MDCRARSNIIGTMLTDCKNISKCYAILCPLTAWLGTVSKGICELRNSVTWIVSSQQTEVPLITVQSEKSLFANIMTLK